MLRIHKYFIIAIVAILIVFGYLMYYLSQIEETFPPPLLIMTGEFDVIVKENPIDKSKSDVYLKNKKTGEEILFMTISYIYREHYHPVEYHNGNLYVIRAFSPNWESELWKYNQQGQGIKLYSGGGFDFRVSNNEEFIAISTTEIVGIAGETLQFIKGDGTTLKVFDTTQAGLENFNFLRWYNNILWVYSNFDTSILNMAKIEVPSFQITKFDLAGLQVTIEESNLNPTKEKIVFSDYPTFYDAEGMYAFLATKQVITLFVYDLKNKNKQFLATSTAKAFYPKWIDENTIEYDNPNNEGRLRKVVP